jgi:hypothetical protein
MGKPLSLSLVPTDYATSVNPFFAPFASAHDVNRELLSRNSVLLAGLNVVYLMSWRFVHTGRAGRSIVYIGFERQGIILIEYHSRPKGPECLGAQHRVHNLQHTVCDLTDECALRRCASRHSHESHVSHAGAHGEKVASIERNACQITQTTYPYKSHGVVSGACDRRSRSCWDHLRPSCNVQYDIHSSCTEAIRCAHHTRK